MRKDGKRCCIGFVGEQCGIKDYELLGRKAIADGFANSTLSSDDPRWPAWMRRADEDEDPIFSAYTINDDDTITDDAREVKLKAIFYANGDEIEFVG